MLLLSLCAGLSLTAQNYSLQFSAKTFVPEANFASIQSKTTSLWTSTSEFNGSLFKLIQFSEIPTDLEKQALQKLGVKLTHYVRNYAWFATLPSNLDPLQLQGFPIRLITDIEAEYKLSRALAREDYPSYALTDQDHIRLSVHAFGTISPTTIGTMLQREGGQLLSENEAFHQLEVLLPIDKIKTIAAFPFIYHISEIAPDPELEQEVNRTSHRSNYIAADYLSGLHFDATGVTAAVSEGMVDTTQIDFHGRLKPDYHTGSSFSGHATGVCRRMGGAGNYNPKDRGMAFGADLLTVNGGIWGNSTIYFTDSLRMANHSYGYGCSYGYNFASETIDNQVRTLPSMMHIFSCGNIGTDSACSYYGAPGWANITGAVKQSKNVIATGAVNAYDVRMNFSSKGPAYDGRIKPDMCAVGPGGTSHAAPGVTGVMAQLYQVYKTHNGGQEPDAGLIKGILQNTADDLGNPGPDFQHGYGRINARRAHNLIAVGNHITDSIANGGSNTHTLVVPAGTIEIRCMVYWTDHEATSGAAAALVNDLDITMTAPNMAVFQPWVLDTAANGVSLNTTAVRGRDSLNNMEQVTIANPTAGTYTLSVDGSLVPMGPQKYYVIYEFVQNELQLTHPTGAEGWVPGENEIIRWDAYGGTGTFDLEFSADSGATWSQIATGVAATQRYYDFTVPDTVSGHCFIRVSGNSLTSESNAPFSIIPVPTNLDLLWSCGDSAMFIWDPVIGATGYEVSRLGAKYMDFAGTSTQTHFMLTGLSTTEPEWLSVKALGPLDARGRRAIAIEKMVGDTNCVPFEGELVAAISPVAGYYPDCIAGTALPVKIQIRNNGVSAFTGIPVAWQLDAGAIHNQTIATTINPAATYDFTFADSINLSTIGTHNIKIWIAVAGDTSNNNDTLSYTIEVYASGTVTPSYTQNFDAFTTCSTAWGCEGVTCGLSQNWFNVPNTPTLNGDSIDFRTDANGTGTGGTGPSADHTTGSGNYLYLETSGNSGSGCQNKQAELHSPCFDLRGTNQPQMSYWYHMYGSSIGSLHIDAFVEGHWDLDIVPEIVGAQGNAWQTQTADLSAYAGKIIFVRFRATTGSGYTGDLAIDDINLNTLPNVAFSANQQIICPGDTVQFTDNSTNINAHNWQISPAGFAFVNGSSASTQNPQVVFNNPGAYTITLIGTNASGADTLIETAYINAGPHFAQILASDSMPCVGELVTFTASAANSASYTFYLNGAAVQSGASTTYLTDSLVAGDIVSVEGAFASGCTTNQDQLTMTVLDAVAMSMVADTNQCPVIAFSSLSSTGAPNVWQWDFGDGSAGAAVQNPIHDYTNAGNGVYNVTLIAGNSCGDDTVIVPITINCLVGVASAVGGEIRVYPNPAQDRIWIDFDGVIDGDVTVRVVDLAGRQLVERFIAQDLAAERVALDLRGLAAGVYVVEVDGGGEVFRVKFFVE